MFIDQDRDRDLELYLTWQEFKLHNRWEHFQAITEDLMLNFL